MDQVEDLPADEGCETVLSQDGDDQYGPRLAGDGLTTAPDGSGTTTEEPDAIETIRKPFDANSFFRVYHAGAFLRVWNVLMLCVIIWLDLFVPLRIGYWVMYQEVQYIPLWNILLLADAVCDVVFLADIMLNFRVTYVQNGKMHSGSSKMAARYMRGWFLLDFCSSLPFDWLLVWSFTHARTIARVPRLLRTLKLIRYFDLWESYASSANIVRLFKMFLAFGLCVHWVACAYFLMGNVLGFGSDGFVPSAGTEDLSLESQYIRGVFWAIVTMTGFGDNGTRPTNNLEFLFQITVIILGLVLFAAIVSNIGTLLRTLNKSKEEYAEKIIVINKFMRNRQLPAGLRKRIRSYYDYMWSKQKGIVDADVLDGFPPNLRTEVELFIHRSTLAKVPIFRNCSNGFLNAVVGYLEAQIYSPADIIISAGDLGNSMYFLSCGTVEVLSEEGQLLAELTEGAFFGEIALLYETKRTATIRAKTYCDMNMLTRERLDMLLEEFPGHRYLIEQEAEGRLSRNEVLRCLRMHSVLVIAGEEVFYDKVSSYMSPQILAEEARMDVVPYTQYLLLTGRMQVLDGDDAVLLAVDGPAWVFEPAPTSLWDSSLLHSPQGGKTGGLQPMAAFGDPGSPVRDRTTSTFAAQGSDNGVDSQRRSASGAQRDSQRLQVVTAGKRISAPVMKTVLFASGSEVCVLTFKDFLSAMDMFPEQRPALLAQAEQVHSAAATKSPPIQADYCHKLQKSKSVARSITSGLPPQAETSTASLAFSSMRRQQSGGRGSFSAAGGKKRTQDAGTRLTRHESMLSTSSTVLEFYAQIILLERHEWAEHLEHLSAEDLLEAQVYALDLARELAAIMSAGGQQRR